MVESSARHGIERSKRAESNPPAGECGRRWIVVVLCSFMGSRKRLAKALGLLVVTSSLAVPSLASAHARLMTPTPRNNSDALKSGPCGGVARGTNKVTYSAGATITVKFEETIGHRGCFQVALSTANDQNFQLLKQVNDPAGGNVTYTETVKLPDAVTCDKCTLVLRQLMQGDACPMNADPTQAAQGTYYSCSDVAIVAGDAGTPVDLSLIHI